MSLSFNYAPPHPVSISVTHWTLIAAKSLTYRDCRRLDCRGGGGRHCGHLHAEHLRRDAKRVFAPCVLKGQRLVESALLVHLVVVLELFVR
jgi:hypothetical protein